MSWILFALALMGAVVALLCWAVYRLVRENGRILRRLDALERPPGRARVEPAEQPAAGTGDRRYGASAGEKLHAVRAANRPPAVSQIKRDGLAPGTPAPLFRLPRLDGGDVSLAQYRGRRLLLVFSDPDCSPCNWLMPELERLHRRSSDLGVLVVSRGDPEANRAIVARHGLTFPVVVQRHWEISRDYAMFRTPMGYLIDQRGVIAADVATDADTILALASPA